MTLRELLPTMLQRHPAGNAEPRRPRTAAGSHSRPATADSPRPTFHQSSLTALGTGLARGCAGQSHRHPTFFIELKRSAERLASALEVLQQRVRSPLSSCLTVRFEMDRFATF